MHEKEGFRPHTNKLKLDIGPKWDWRKNFGEKRCVGSREIEELSRYMSEC